MVRGSVCDGDQITRVHRSVWLLCDNSATILDKDKTCSLPRMHLPSVLQQEILRYGGLHRERKSFPWMRSSAITITLITLISAADGGKHDGRVKAFSVPNPESNMDSAPLARLRAARTLDLSALDMDLEPNPKEWLSPTSHEYTTARREAGLAPSDCSDLLQNATRQEDGTYILWNPPVPWLPPRNGTQVCIAAFPSSLLITMEKESRAKL